MGFPQINDLKGHMRQHTGEKPFKREHGDKAFTHNISLRKDFCEALDKRPEPLDFKKPNVGRPSKKKSTGSENEGSL